MLDTANYLVTSNWFLRSLRHDNDGQTEKNTLASTVVIAEEILLNFGRRKVSSTIEWIISKFNGNFYRTTTRE